MPLLYSLVARGTTVLVKHATCTGNFEDVTEHILSKIPPENDKLTYSQGPYLFHYICEDRIIYMCISNDDFQRSRAFLFLNEIKRRFLAAYGQGIATAMPYAMNTEFSSVLANEMKHYSTSKDIDTLSKVHGELDELKDIMVRNIDNIAMRGERLELLVNKTENLTASSVTFRATSRNLARAMFWKSVKLYVTVAVVLVEHYSTSKDIDTLSEVHGALVELMDIMVRDIDDIVMRGDLLVNNAENSPASSGTFRVTSRNLARTMFWTRVKLYGTVAVVLVVVIYYIVSKFCGGLAWQKCVGN